MKCLLTGASGFVGRALHPELLARGHKVICAGRVARLPLQLSDYVQVGPINAFTDWSAALADVEVIVHLIARAHVLRERGVDFSVEFRTVNVLGTLNLARQAAKSGVRRFVFISSIGVNGVKSDKPFTADDAPAPQEPYAVSKWEAERGLEEIGRETGMQIVIIRPPLVYGPNAPGNFGRLVQALKKGIPLPFGAVHNRRTLVALDNLVDLIDRCITHPAAADQVFLAGDAEDLSTTQLLRAVGLSLGKPARLLPVPVNFMEMIGALMGRR
ncbi:NAD-dependent epimerase/dehydratase family protein, partial [Pseudomonas aeruginosa]